MKGGTDKGTGMDMRGVCDPRLVRGDSYDKSLVERFLRQVPIFAGLSDNYFNQMADAVRLRRVSSNKIIFYQLDASSDFYIILSGRVKASLFNDEGDELVLAFFEEGNFFGEMGLIDGVGRSATVTAEEDSVVGVLERDRFLDVIRQNSSIVVELFLVLADRLRATDVSMASMVFLDVSERVERFLIKTAEEQGAKNEDGLYKIKKIPHLELASNTGSSRAAVTKALRLLAFKKMLIEKDGHFLIRLDRQEGK